MSYSLKLMAQLGSLKLIVILEGVGAWHVAKYFNEFYHESTVSWAFIWMMLWLILATSQLALFVWYVRRMEHNIADS